jgi:hypothetical protein
MNIGSTAHQDTIQHFSFDNNAFFSGATYQDTVIFASNRCAVNGGLRNTVFRNCWINARKNNQTPRYPIGPGAEMASAGLSQGTKANITFDGGVYMGSLQSNTGASPNPYPTVMNGAKIDYQPSGQAAPLNGSWVVDTTMNGFTNPGYPPLPTDDFLNSIWGGGYIPPVGQTSQPSLDRSGTYYASTVVQMSSPTSGAEIRYTTNGSTPSLSSTLYTGPITVSSTTTFKVIAFGDSPLLPSNVITNTITITNDLLSNTSWQNIPLSSNLTEDFSIVWRTTPSASAMDSVTGISNIAVNAYTQLPIIIRYNTSNQFDAMSGSVYANTNSVTYTPGVEYEVKVDARLSNKTYDVTITPRPSGVAGTPVILANNFPFRTTANTISNIANLAMISSVGAHTISNVEINGGGAVLEVAAPPIFDTDQPGNYSTPIRVTLATPESGAEIRYKIAPSVTEEVTSTDLLYTEPIFLTNSTSTIKARTFVSGKQPSVHIEGSFTVETIIVVDPFPTESPSISPFPKIFLTGSPPEITITPYEFGYDHVIYYTIDGSTPTTSSTVYTTPFTIPNATTTVKAIAVGSGRPPSDVVSSYYQIGSGGPPTPPTPDNGSNPPSEPTQGVTEILTPKIFANRAQFVSEITISQPATIAVGGLATTESSGESDITAGWKLNGVRWQVLSGSVWADSSVVTLSGNWQVRIIAKPRAYDIDLRESGEDLWISLGKDLPFRFRSPIDRTIYQSTIYPITVKEISAVEKKILLL